MAEETIVELLVPEKIEFEGKVNNNGVRDSDTNNGANTLRRTSSIGSDSNLNNSGRNSNSLKITQKPIPRYLSASTGSCHDFCKYGRRHAMEENTKRPLRKLLQNSLPNKLDPVQISVCDEKKEKLVKHKSSLDTNGHSRDSKPSFITSHSHDRKLSLDIKTNLLRPGFEKVKIVKQKSSIDTNNRSPAQPSFYKSCSPDRKLSLDKKINLTTSKVEKVKVVKQKSSMDTNNRLPDSKPSFIKPHAPDRKFSLDKRTSFPLSKVEKIKCVRQKSSLDRNLSTEPRSCLPKRRTSFDAKTYGHTQDGTSGDKSLRTEKTLSSDHSGIIKREMCLPSQIDVPEKKIVTGGKTSKTEEWKYSSPSTKVKPVKVNASSSGNSDATRVKTGQRKDLKSTRKIKMIGSGRKGSALPTATFSPRASLSKSTAIKVKKSVGPNLNIIQIAGTKMTEIEKVPEETLQVIKTESENNALELESETISNDKNVAPSVPSSPSHTSSSNGSSSYLPHEQDNQGAEHSAPSHTLSSNGSSYYLPHKQDDQGAEHSASDTDGSSTDKSETLEIHEKEYVEENKKNPHSPVTMKKNKAIASEVKYRSPVKLKFRSGKVVDLHSDNTTTPRRLRFRKARILSADQVKVKGDFARRTFKKAGSGNGANNGHSSEKVSLKHQDVQGKKDERDLFNNVIEETASKLAETRKSKVLALVGAFETIISLQEIKPSPHAAN